MGLRTAALIPEMVQASGAVHLTTREGSITQVQTHDSSFVEHISHNVGP